MDAIQTVLVVAPDKELRRSIVFALEAEGFWVRSCSLLSIAHEYHRPGLFACIIIDENAIGGQRSGWEQVVSLATPSILLIDRMRHVPAIDLMTVLTKPLLGRVLVDAVFDAVNRQASGLH